MEHDKLKIRLRQALMARPRDYDTINKLLHAIRAKNN